MQIAWVTKQGLSPLSPFLQIISSSLQYLELLPEAVPVRQGSFLPRGTSLLQANHGCPQEAD